MNQPNPPLKHPSRPMLALLSDGSANTPEHIRTARMLERCRESLDPQHLGPRVTYFAGARERMAL